MLGFVAYGTKPPRPASSHRHGYGGSILRIDVRASGDVLGQIRRFGHLWENVWLSRRDRYKKLFIALAFCSVLAVLILVPLLVATIIVVSATVGHSFGWPSLIAFAESIHPDFDLWRFPDHPRMWSLFVAFMLMALALFFALVRDKICSVDLYLLGPNEPFPLIAIDTSPRYVLAVRVLEPNVAKRVREYLTVAQLRDFADRPEENQTLDRQELYGHRAREGRMADDAWMLVRFAISRTLLGSSSELVTPRSLRFAFKVHLPQIKAFLILLILALVVPLSGVLGKNATDAQYSLLLGALGFAWAYWAIHLHREQQRSLVRWEQEWRRKPFSGCPMFFFDAENSPEQRWEELSDAHFEVPITAYGLRMQDALEIALSVFLVSYLAMLQLIK